MARGGASLDDAVIVAIGGNLAGGFASCEALLGQALQDLEARGVPIVRRSGWWRSAAWPDPAEPEYRNAVALAAPIGSPQELLDILLLVEADFARARGARNAARTLDLDLIAHGRQIIDGPRLTVPHPRAHARLFVMGPLAEIAPHWRHPVLGLTASELAARATIGADARPLT